MVGHTKHIVETKKKVKEPTSDELLANIMGEPKLDGFRKGVTKKDIIQSLTPEDWVFIDNCKAYEDRITENEYAGKSLLRNDQLRQEFEKLKISIYTNLVTASEFKEGIVKNDIDIAKGETFQANAGNQIFSLADLIHQNRRWALDIQSVGNLLISNINKLYTFVGKQGLDRKPFFTEEEYNAIAKNTVSEFEKLGYKLL